MEDADVVANSSTVTTQIHAVRVASDLKKTVARTKTEFAKGHANPYAIAFLRDLEAIIEECNNVCLSENPRDELISMLDMTCMYREVVIEHRILFQYLKQILELCRIPVVHAGRRDEIPALFRSDVRVRVLATLFTTDPAEYIYGVEQINLLSKKRLWAGNDRTDIDFEAPQKSLVAPATPASIAASELADADQSVDASVSTSTETAGRVISNVRAIDQNVPADGEQTGGKPDTTDIAAAIAQAVVEATKHRNHEKPLGDRIRETTTIIAQFKNDTFSGELAQNFTDYQERYETVCDNISVSQERRLELFHYVVSGGARETFKKVVLPHATSYSELIIGMRQI
jgi:hypothetical protein